ncbi:MAG TPA: protein-disulfide reductase DsbD [Gammaproteobacteria bacterium]|jgi:thiol:disulfide interchange protein DsbD|nr:protein-disulfide reductase DsbD [Gammaproteobacteria bacterium]
MRQLLLGLITTIFLIGCGFAAEPLRPDQAFQVSAQAVDGNQIMTHWKLAPGYYLYVEKLKFETEPDISFTATLPASISKMDPVRGEIQVYAGEFDILLHLQSQAAALKLNIAYQGCSQQGFCYPPEKKSFDLHFLSASDNVVNNIVTNQGISALMTNQYGVQSLLAYENRGILLLVFLGLGILMAFTPCVLPMLPILTGIIAGQKRHATMRKSFLLSLVYVLGMSVTYALAGVLAAFAGGSLQVLLQTPAVIIACSLIFVVLAFSLFEFYELPVSRRWQNIVTKWSNRHEGGTFVGVFFMGILSTLVVSPCVTAPLVGVLLYIGRTGDMMLGGSALFVMGLGMGIPLILLGMSAGHWLPKSGQWMHAVTKSFGVIMLGMAIWLLGRIIPTNVMMVLWGLYLIGIALFFSFYLTRIIGRHKINHTFGFTAALLGVFMILNTFGMTSVLNRWTGESGSITDRHYADFYVVHDSSQLAARLAEAKASGQPVLVDFYADWCTSCVLMDNEVFTKKKVQSALQPFVLIRVDLSQNTSEDQALLHQYDVIAPPTVLFYNASGQEVNNRRIVGELNATEFLNRINLFIAASCDTKAQC